MSINLKISRVGRMKILFSSKMAIKLRGRHKKSGSVGLAETQLFFLRSKIYMYTLTFFLNNDIQ